MLSIDAERMICYSTTVYCLLSRRLLNLLFDALFLLLLASCFSNNRNKKDSAAFAPPLEDDDTLAECACASITDAIVTSFGLGPPFEAFCRISFKTSSA